MENHTQAIKELTLMLLYLTSWEEKDPLGEKYPRSWKGYDFDVLNELADEEMIYQSIKSKSVNFSNEGVSKAKELLDKYGISR